MIPLGDDAPYFDQTLVSFACASSDIVPVAVGCTIVAYGIKYATDDPVSLTLFYEPTGLPVGKTFNTTSFPAPEFTHLDEINYELENVEDNAVLLYLDNNAYTAHFST